MNNEVTKFNNTFFSYRSDLDGLRAIAVIAVIINHFNKEILPSGYLGVDIFFVLSGYVITSSIYRRKNDNFKEFILGFYKRRIKRIVPALLFFVLVMSLLVCLFNPKPEISLVTGLRSLIGFLNIYLFNQSTDYFATQTEYNFLLIPGLLG